MADETVPTHVVVTRFCSGRGSEPIIHTYGPYILRKARAVERAFVREFRSPLWESTVSKLFIPGEGDEL